MVEVVAERLFSEVKETTHSRKKDIWYATRLNPGVLLQRWDISEQLTQAVVLSSITSIISIYVILPILSVRSPADITRGHSVFFSQLFAKRYHSSV